MAKTIQQTVKFGASPERLFDIYMDSKKHSAAINSTASVQQRVGGRFAAFEGQLRGKILALVPRRMIVQSWRGSDWKKIEPDSILILTFDRARGGASLSLVHANIPDRHYAGIRRGWTKYYWNPWRAYLRKAKRR
jgi:activator of HSP90 ATPase